MTRRYPTRARLIATVFALTPFAACGSSPASSTSPTSSTTGGTLLERKVNAK